MKRKIFVPYIKLIIAILFAAPATAQTAHQLKTIILDPGHGYPTLNAHGRYSYESDVTVAIGLKLKKKIEDSLPGVKVLMTRSGRNDAGGYTNPNEANHYRAQFANENHGDLYISIHCNDAGSNVIHHSEIIGHHTKVWYTGKGKKRRKHTRRENEYRTWTTPNPVRGTETLLWKVGKNDVKQQFIQGSQDTADLFAEKDSSNNMTVEQKIMASLRMQKYFNRSKFLADLIQQNYKDQGRIIHDDAGNGVKQRTEGIWVLQATAMPSVLTEVGFISNPEDEDYMNSQAGQDQIASAIFNAIVAYKTQVDTGRVR